MDKTMIGHHGYSHYLIGLMAQQGRDDYKMNHAEMLDMANTLDVMRQMANLHNTGAMPGDVYGAISLAESSILGHLFGENAASQIMNDVVDSGESIAHVMASIRDEDEMFARETGWECKVCREPSPQGVGYLSGSPETPHDVDKCPCGHSVKP